MKFSNDTCLWVRKDYLDYICMCHYNYRAVQTTCLFVVVVSISIFDCTLHFSSKPTDFLSNRRLNHYVYDEQLIKVIQSVILKAKKTHGFNSCIVISVHPLDILSI